MTIRFNLPSGWPQDGRAFNHAVVAPEGHVLYITGQVAWDHQGNVVGANDAGAQMRVCFENTIRILAAVGGTLEDIVNHTIYFVEHSDIEVLQQVRTEYFSLETAPASTYIQVLGLIIPEFLVELAPIAVIPHERFVEPVAA